MHEHKRYSGVADTAIERHSFVSLMQLKTAASLRSFGESKWSYHRSHRLLRSTGVRWWLMIAAIAVVLMTFLNSVADTMRLLSLNSSTTPLYNHKLLNQMISSAKSGRIDNTNYAIFYHVFLNPARVPYSYGLVDEQLSQWTASNLSNATLYYGLVGNATYPFPCPVRATCRELFRGAGGWEVDTLQQLYEYCVTFPTHNVVYLHDKGSYHDHEGNHRLRRILTRSAVSDECITGLASGKCTVCSARFSPLPHWHTTGNMWTARCNYVSKLIAPRSFGKAVQRAADAFDWKGIVPPDNGIGTGRFAAEHWIHAYAQVQPCDVVTDPGLTWGYTSFDEHSSLELKYGLRFPLDFYTGNGFDKLALFNRFQWRLFELQQLYNDTPPIDGFAWMAYAKADMV